MSWRLFIDECLSPSLATMAHNAGFEATCARDLGLLGTKDRMLIHKIIAGDYTLVTRNARDFRGQGAASPGGLYALQEIHPGLICLNSHAMLTQERQRRLFDYALARLTIRPDLINQALEICEEKNGALTILEYDLFKQAR